MGYTARSVSKLMTTYTSPLFSTLNQNHSHICISPTALSYYPFCHAFYGDPRKLKKLRILIEKIIELPYFQTLYKNCYIYISYFGEKYNFIIDKS